jgi:DNA-binding LytR/AlgR family response regulator
MKLHIAICDDEHIETEYLVKLTREWAEALKIETIISSYDSAEAFLFAYEADKCVDILLLDIHMKQLDGVALARRLRAEGGRMQIVFITGLPDFIAEGYEVSALHYLMKPVGKEKLSAVLDKALRLLNKAEEFILVETENAQMKILHRDILYIEAFAHTTAIWPADGKPAAQVPIPIGELETRLGGGFYRVHRSYLVGLRYIRQINKNEVVMDNGCTVPLSRRRYDAVSQAFIQFYKTAGSTFISPRQTSRS